MNSLNILSARVIGQTISEKAPNNRPRSHSDGKLNKGEPELKLRRSTSEHVKAGFATYEEKQEDKQPSGDTGEEDGPSGDLDEKTPLLARDGQPMKPFPKHDKLRLAAKRLVDALTASLKWVLSTLASPGVYILASFYDEKGAFSPLTPVRKLSRVLPKRNGSKSTAQAVGLSGAPNRLESSADSRTARRRTPPKELRRRRPGADSFSTAPSDSETDVGEKTILLDSPPESRPRLQTSSSSEEAPQARRSIRIKLHNEDTTRRRKQRREKGEAGQNSTSSGNDKQLALTIANIKSPTSPTSSLRMTKYPRVPAPPRPLIPQRQPSYSAHTLSRSSRLARKTLVIDLDETLIHSVAKGGRMSSGHMVEVKLNTTVGYGGAHLGPQHPILYYVHKRPHCDDFLRKVCKWYNLVVFTASVQQYADPVIDWLEQERKYFSGRYYRQHCTFRNGASIKDLSSVEPDLSKVMILDNSPLSYIFHEGINPIRVPSLSVLSDHP